MLVRNRPAAWVIIIASPFIAYVILSKLGDLDVFRSRSGVPIVSGVLGIVLNSILVLLIGFLVYDAVRAVRSRESEQDWKDLE